MAKPLSHTADCIDDIKLHPKVEWLPFVWDGPLARLPDGTLVALDGHETHRSGDGGSTWTSAPSFPVDRATTEVKPSREMSLCVTRKGTLVAAFMNLNERQGLGWDASRHDGAPGCRLPQYVMRSADGGLSWSRPLMLHEDWTGEVRDLIETRSGRLVLSSMRFLHNPGRHAVVSYVSDDDGASWRTAQTIDLGGQGHHGGVTEATIEQMRDGRIRMLLRTNWGCFWQAMSSDEGLTWRDIRPTAIASSSAPGLLKRLQSGRLMLLWNRPFPEGKDEFPMSGGDGNWSEVPVSNHRSQLSLAFSDDDGETFGPPTVIASRQPDKWLSYPRTLEVRPGEIWLTTMQGGLHVCFREDDFR